MKHKSILRFSLNYSCTTELSAWDTMINEVVTFSWYLQLIHAFNMVALYTSAMRMGFC